MGLKGFIEGGIASVVAGCATHPLDLIKVRMQLHSEPNTFSAAAPLRATFAFPSPAAASISLPHPRTISVGAHILRSEGPAALFSGVSAAVLRHALYSTTSMGLYDVFKISRSTDPAGSLPSISRSPPGSLLEASAPPSATRPTSPKFGCRPTAACPTVSAGTMPASAMPSAGWCRRREQLSSGAVHPYGEPRHDRDSNTTGLGTHVAASLVAGAVAAVTSNLVDVVKTRVMNMRVEVRAAPMYAGAVDCAVRL